MVSVMYPSDVLFGGDAFGNQRLYYDAHLPLLQRTSCDLKSLLSNPILFIPSSKPAPITMHPPANRPPLHRVKDNEMPLNWKDFILKSQRGDIRQAKKRKISPSDDGSSLLRASRDSPNLPKRPVPTSVSKKEGESVAAVIERQLQAPKMASVKAGHQVDVPSPLKKRKAGHVALVKEDSSEQKPKNMASTTLPSAKKPRGFHNNSGYHCYRNAAVQALVNVKAFRRACFEHNCGGEPRCVACPLEKVMKGHFESNTKRGTHNPLEFVDIARKLGKPFSRHGQQDSTEYVLRLLERVEDSHRSLKKAVMHAFAGKFDHSVKCCSRACGYDSKKADIFTSINLTIPAINPRANIKKAHTLHELLQAYTTPTRVDDYKCEKCQKKGASKGTRISFVPNNAFLVLNRFEAFAAFRTPKNQTAIKYPATLEWSPYLAEDPRVPNPKSVLSAVICHQGRTIQSGHYVAYVYNAEMEQWYCCDDSHVYEVDANFVLKQTQTAYGLFYRRVV